MSKIWGAICPIVGPNCVLCRAQGRNEMMVRIISAAAAAMSEDEFEHALRNLLNDLDLYGYHAHDSRRSAKGWPDWVIIGRQVLYRELKTEAGRLTAEQRHVGNLLIVANADWKIWRPSDLLAGRVGAELAAITRGP